MFDKLENCLNNWVTPERLELIMGCFQILGRHGSYRAWTEVSKYLDEDTKDDTLSETIDVIEGCLEIDMNHVLSEHAIVMDSPLQLKCDVLEGLWTMQSIDDSDSILQIINAADNEIEAFINLLAFCLNKPWEYFSEGIVSVSSSLIDKLEQLVTERTVTLEENVNALPNLKLDKLLGFMNKYADSIVYNAVVNEGRRSDMDVSLVMDLYKLPLTLIENRDPSLAAREIVGLVLLSTTPLDSLSTTAKAQLDIIYSDITFITQVSSFIDTFIQEVLNG